MRTQNPVFSEEELAEIQREVEAAGATYHCFEGGNSVVICFFPEATVSPSWYDINTHFQFPLFPDEYRYERETARADFRHYIKEGLEERAKRGFK